MLDVSEYLTRVPLGIFLKIICMHECMWKKNALHVIDMLWRTVGAHSFFLRAGVELLVADLQFLCYELNRY